jgi:hypothetical protein
MKKKKVIKIIKQILALNSKENDKPAIWTMVDTDGLYRSIERAHKIQHRNS